MNTKYIHSIKVHNEKSPKIIVDLLVSIFNPKSVIDVGCGLGTFVKEFREKNIKSVGVDGSWVDKTLLLENMPIDAFHEKDLEKKFVMEDRFDMAISLEVAEHISESSADIFVENLVNLSDVVVFSAAIPLQGGQNHINEQWTTYWNEKFNFHGYNMYNFLRPKIWNQTEVFWWYKQNIVVFSKLDLSHLASDYNEVKDVIHPELFHIKTSRLEAIETGKLELKYYIKLLLKKCF